MNDVTKSIATMLVDLLDAIESMKSETKDQLTQIKVEASGQNKLLDIDDLTRLGLSRSTVYNLFNRTDFPTLRIGGRKYVRAVKWHEWCDKVESGEIKVSDKDKIVVLNA